MKYSLFVLLLILVLLTAGCINENRNSVVTPIQTTQFTKNTPLIKPTVDEKLWQQIVDNTYTPTATGGLNKITIPIAPNTVYRLNVNGEKRMSIMIYDEKKEDRDAQGRLSGISYTNTKYIVNNIINYNGIIKTDSLQKNLLITWVYYNTETSMIGTSQNVKVKLERYYGDTSIFPDTTSNSPV